VSRWSNARAPLTHTSAFGGLTWRPQANPAFGIKVAKPPSKQTTFHADKLGHLCPSSRLKEAFERVQRYCHVASDAIEYEFPLFSLCVFVPPPPPLSITQP